MKRLRFIVISFVFIAFPGVSVSKVFLGSESHRTDFCGCLGVECKPGQDIYRTLKEFSGLIDDVNEFYRQLKNEFKFRRKKGESHRILFHWGFNEDPKSAEALTERVEQSVPGSKQVDFYKAVIAEQQRRNVNMISLIQRGFGIRSRKKAGALTTILYNIHILGDYACSTCSDFSSLYPIERLVNDLNSRGIKKLFPFSPERNQLIGEINGARRKGNSSEASRKILIILKKDFPHLFEGHFSSELASKGIKFKGTTVQGRVKKIRVMF